MSREVNSSHIGNIHSIGSNHPNGTYCLRISLKEPTTLVFGRFGKGKPISLKVGEYLYIGSALATRGSTTLGNRLRRHTSRSPEFESHNIQKELLLFFDEIGISYASKPAPKKMFWNIDHLLNLPFAEIIGIIFIRDPKPLENLWSEHLEQLLETSIFEKGLGANDSAGHTHIQYSMMSNPQWSKLLLELPI
ncbi:MAG: DUF123 domain-containing protein [Candidatus Heimdallarchaeota archaeon]|nr:DUF123 domain-containing protein [Candidatus Heimdallarchaeota archaeon]